MYSGALLVLRLLPCGEAKYDACAEVTAEGTSDGTTECTLEVTVEGAIEGLAVVLVVVVLATLKSVLLRRSKSSRRRASRTSLNRPTGENIRLKLSQLNKYTMRKVKINTKRNETIQQKL